MMLIAHSRPDIAAADTDAVGRQLRSGLVAEGSRTAELETGFAEAVGAAHALATGSGSQALLLALQAADVAAGDEVIMPNYVCGEVLGVTRYLGARPVVVDVDDDFLMSLPAARNALSDKTKAIVLPYTLGVFRDPRPFCELGPVVIEDCAQFIDPLPHRISPVFGELAVYSFEGSKIIAAGEGGMVTTNDPQIAERLRSSKRISGSPFKLNLFPLSDLQASLALAQLARLPELLARRREIADRYFGALAGLPNVDLPVGLRERSIFFRFPVRLPGGGEQRVHAAIAAFAEQGIVVRRPVTPLLDSLVALQHATPTADRLHAQTLSIPLYPALENWEVEKVAEVAGTVLARHS